MEWEGHPEVAEMVELQRAGMREGEREQDATQQEEATAMGEPIPATKRGRRREFKEANQFALLDVDN